MEYDKQWGENGLRGKEGHLLYLMKVGRREDDNKRISKKEDSIKDLTI
jgi:hypothetical protein